jgi:VIT1/CCC1 family predicted Fe2+/Mn2+ transporter
LSEREQRILEEIEKDLYQQDPGFARGVKREAPAMKDRRKVKTGVIGFIGGFVLLLAFFTTSNIFLGVAAFGVMVAGIVLIAGSLLGSIAPRRPPGPGLSTRATETFRSLENKLRSRYRRRD